MGRRLTISLTVIAVSVLILALFAEPALAAQSAEQTGQKFGKFLHDLFVPIVVSIGGVMGIAALIKRDFVMALVLIGLTLVVLGFFMEPNPYQKWGEPIIKQTFGAGMIGLPR